MTPNEIVTPMNQLTGAIKGLTGAFDQYQKATTSIGVSYKDATAILAENMEGLTGSLNTRFTSALEVLSAGLGTNSKGVTQLINEQKLTNQNSKQTAKIFRDLQTSFGMNTESLNKLAAKTTEMANQFGMTSTALLKVIDALKETSPVQLLTGIADTFNEAAMSLTASFGPGMQNEVTKFINMFMDPSFENMNKLALLGVEDMRERIVNAKDAATQERLIREAIMKASQTVGAFGEQGEMTFRQTQVAIATLGKDVGTITNLANQMGTKQKTEAEQLAELGQDFQTMIDNIVTPFQKLMMEQMMPALQEFVAGGMPTLKLVSENLAVFVGSFFTEFHKTAELTGKLIEFYLKKGIMAIIEPFGLVTEQLKQDYISSQEILRGDTDRLFKELKDAHQARVEEAAEAAKARNKGLEYQERMVGKSRPNLEAASYNNMSSEVLADSLFALISGEKTDDGKMDRLIESSEAQVVLTEKLVDKTDRTPLNGGGGK